MKKLYIPKNSYLLKEIIKTKINKTSYWNVKTTHQGKGSG